MQVDGSIEIDNDVPRLLAKHVRRHCAEYGGYLRIVLTNNGKGHSLIRAIFGDVVNIVFLLDRSFEPFELIVDIRKSIAER